MTIKTLYSNAFAPSPLRVNLMLKLKGIQLETVDIDLMTGAQFSEDYKKISKEGTVPAAVLDDGTVLTDVIAILNFIENSYPESKRLMGNNATEQAQILGLIHRIYFLGLASVAEVLRNGFAPGFENRAMPGSLAIKQIPELMERGRSRLEHFYEQMNQQLEGREFLVGDAISQADLDLFVLCKFAGMIKEQLDPNQAPNLAGHFANVGKIIESA